MVKHTSATTARDIAKSTNTRADQTSVSKSSQSTRHTDDIILSLSNAYENKRARQVTEWERAQVTRWNRAA